MTETRQKAETKKGSDPENITPEEKKRLLIWGIKKTVVPAFIGAFFAIIFFLKFEYAKDVTWFSAFLLVILISYYVQRFTYSTMGVKVNEFEIKDWLYVEFMTIIFFMVSWTLLLNN
ncbi:MAG: hypothetical protein J5U17_00815 [Candidatus Methanoperedens sp.]|nr:hypothetical protein [Candidatus Methanoperedens sp.]MCE8426827.1 hypothetical protein [Candidatus Methanoperedens sp.]